MHKKDKEIIWTDEKLKELNELAYRMEGEYIEIDQSLKTTSGMDVYIIDAVQGLEGEGYNGLAVAPIINEKPDLSQIVIVSKGTNVGVNDEIVYNWENNYGKWSEELYCLLEKNIACYKMHCYN